MSSGVEPERQPNKALSSWVVIATRKASWYDFRPRLRVGFSARRAPVLSCTVESRSALAGLPIPPRPGEGWKGFGETMANLRDSEWPVDLERARFWYEPRLERIHEDADTRRADLLQLEQIASGYPSRERFLTELTLDPPDATSDQAGVPFVDEDYLILSTIHSGKGQEWKSVYLLNEVDGCMASDLGAGTSAEIEEERRLLSSP
jgi:DNA helicase II / ATP-dependent DNA helicase PcrA